MKLSNINFDICKIICCIMVVAIHALGNQWLFPFVRVAVPMFFSLSSYFLFGKIEDNNADRHNKVIYQFITKNAKLYIFWFILLFPVTAQIRGYFDGDILMMLRNIIKSMLFSSTFIASWYISAMVLAIVIVYILSKKLSDLTLIIVGIISYSFCALVSCYRSTIPLVNSAYSVYYRILLDPCFSFPAALFWVETVKLFARGYRLSNGVALLGGFCSTVTLYVEWLLVFKVTGSFNNDCYFSLIPLVFCLFAFLINMKQHYSNGLVWFRKMTVIIYTSHASIVWLLRKYIFLSGLNLFVITLILSVTIGCIILNLENKKGFSWLVNAH